MLPIDVARLGAYVAVMAVFAVTPGPANLFAIGTGLRGGARAALMGVAGMNAASLVWIGAAGLGLAALARALPDLFRALTLAGAAYVAWLGLRSILKARRPAAIDPGGGRAAAGEPHAAFRSGFMVQISNPKALIFFGAVLPAFIDPARPAGPQILILGATTIGLDVAAMSGYGLMAGALAHRLSSPRARAAFSACSGLLLLAAGLLIVLRGV